MADSNREDWDESLGDLEDLLGCVADLETEDVVYLEEYLNGKESAASCSVDAFSPVHCVPSASSSWSVWEGNEDQVESIDPLAHVKQIWDDEDVDISVGEADYPSAVSKNGSSNSGAARGNKGVKQPRFVSYHVLPPSKGHGSQCEVCGLWLSSRAGRWRHILTRHVRDRSNVCDICGKAFVFKFALKTHKAVHAPSPSHECVCGASFNLRTSYMDHIRRIHHAATTTHTCHLCFKSFHDRCTLRVHLVSVHKPKTVACQHPGCPKVFSTKGLMRSHYRYHLNQRFACDECGKSFSTEAYMYKHRLTHSGIRPYRCLDCGRTYLSVSHLNKHRRAAHSNLRLHQCSICGKCYKTRDHLTFHESSHRGEKPYKCDKCGYATAYRNTYYAHRKKCSSSVHHAGQSTSIKVNVHSRMKNELAMQAKVKSKGKLPRMSKTLKVQSDEATNSTKELSGFNTVLPQVLTYRTSNCVSSGENVVMNGGGDVSVLGEGTEGTEGLTSLNLIHFMLSGSSHSYGLHSELPSVEKPATESIHLSTDTESTHVSPSYSSSAAAKNSPQESLKENLCIEGLNYIQNSRLEILRLFTQNESLNEIGKTSLDNQDSLMLLYNIGKCAVHNCGNNDNSLLLFKTDDNSYIGLCSQHALVDNREEGNGIENGLEGDEDSGSPSVPATLVEENGDLEISIASKGTVGADVKETQCQTSKHQTQPLLISVTEKVSARNDSTVQVIPNVSLDCNPHPPEHGKLGLEEQFPAMLELDSGVASLSGHIVEDSFSLAQLEVQCPLCDQFLSMDSYVTHLECSHN